MEDDRTSFDLQAEYRKLRIEHEANQLFIKEKIKRQLKAKKYREERKCKEKLAQQPKNVD